MAAIPVNAREIAGIHPKNLRVFAISGLLPSFAVVAALKRRGGCGAVGEIDFTSYVLGNPYHRILQNAVVGWGDDSGADFSFLREQSERPGCCLW